ncbi:MAG: SRPBCC domain-containing protein [Methanomassiliicoccales archaeon]
MPKTKTIHQKVVIPATPRQVYDAFMSVHLHAEFTGDVAEGSAAVGGEFHAYGDYITAKNVQLVPGELIVQEWTTSEWPEGAPPSILKLELNVAPLRGTEIFLTQTSVPAEQAADYEAGWKEFYWDKLVAYFSKGPGK